MKKITEPKDCFFEEWGMLFQQNPLPKRASCINQDDLDKVRRDLEFKFFSNSKISIELKQFNNGSK